MAKTLQLNFGTSSGKKMMLTVDEPREDLVAQDVSTAMQEIIDAETFGIEGHVLETAISARIIERNVTDLFVG